MATSTDTQRCRLLQLPGELRNRIYRLALLRDTDDRVIVTATGYEVSALLQTCKTTRSEALKIFYYENPFDIDTRDYDPAPVLHFIDTLTALGLDSEGIRISGAVWSKDRNWTNFCAMLASVHAGRFLTLPPSPKATLNDTRSTTEDVVACGLVAMVKGLKCLPWEHVERMLRKQRPVLVKVDARWRRMGRLGEEGYMIVGGRHRRRVSLWVKKRSNCQSDAAPSTDHQPADCTSPIVTWYEGATKGVQNASREIIETTESRRLRD